MSLEQIRRYICLHFEASKILVLSFARPDLEGQVTRSNIPSPLAFESLVYLSCNACTKAV